MSDLLERESRTVDLAPGDFDRLVRRRDRRRRNQRIAAGVVGFAVFAAAVSIVWGVGSFDRTSQPSGVPGGAGTDPFISIQAQLTTDEGARDLFTVRTDHPGYWRMYALDLFDGVSFTSSDPDASRRGNEYTSPVELPQLAGIDIPEGTLAQSYIVRILTDIPGPWLPLPYGSETLTLTHGQLNYDSFLNQAVANGGLGDGFNYSVRARDVLPSAEDLDAASAELLTGEQYGVWTSLPESLDPRIEQIARSWTDREPNAYRKVVALQQRFRGGGFAYDSMVEPSESEGELLDFLTTSKRGFCQQYATAMAVLVRALGLPARVAVGYLPGTQQDGRYLVQTKDAHAWVEVYFPTYGWLPFDPTPRSPSLPIAVAGSYLDPVASTEGS